MWKQPEHLKCNVFEDSPAQQGHESKWSWIELASVVLSNENEGVIANSNTIEEELNENSLIYESYK